MDLKVLTQISKKYHQFDPCFVDILIDPTVSHQAHLCLTTVYKSSQLQVHPKCITKLTQAVSWT